jgi:hypothetical protein
MGDDDIDLEIDQFRKQGRQPAIIAVGPAVLDDYIPPLLIAEIAQPHAKRLGAFGQAVGRGQAQKSDAKDFAR